MESPENFDTLVEYSVYKTFSSYPYWTVPWIRRLHSSFSSSSVHPVSLSLACLKSGRKKRGEDCKAGSASRRLRQLLFLHSGKSSRESNLPVCYCIQTTLFHTHASLFSLYLCLFRRYPHFQSVFLPGLRDGSGFSWLDRHRSLKFP